MIQLFDKFEKFETPTFVLCNPNREQLFSLSDILDRKLSLRYNALSELSFTAPYKVNGIISPHYLYLDYKRLVYIPNIGYFMITEVEVEDDGIIKEKKIKCYSLEVELSYKRVNLFEGTYRFYDPLGGENLLDALLKTYAPSWKIGYVDPNLTVMYRYIKATDTSIYNLLMEDVEQAFQCIFTFNTMTRTVNAYTQTTAIKDTDIYLSFNNLVEDMSFKQITNELITALNVYGGGDLDISTVNPLGNTTIYDFTYYKNTSWMSQSLINAVTAWENRVNSFQVQYATILSRVKGRYATLLQQQATLVTLESEYASLEGIIKVRIEKDLDYSAISTQLIAKQIQISNQIETIDLTKTAIEQDKAMLRSINNTLSIKNLNNFSLAQQEELSNFIIGSTYQNENFIQTDIMTPSEIQDMAQELYNQARQILAKVSRPRFEFELSNANFVFLKEYSYFISQLDLGISLTVELEDNIIMSGTQALSNGKIAIKPYVLGIDLNYDDPSDFKLILSNRLRLDDGSFEFVDLLNSVSKGSIDANFNSEIWSSWNNIYKEDVNNFINSSLDASKNEVINAVNQEIIINTNGLQGRSIPTDGYNNPVAQTGGTPVYEKGKLIYYADRYGNPIYSPEKVWLTNNTLAFTKDNWNTASLALGKINMAKYDGGSGTAYGLVADAIIGRLMIGNSLMIRNTNNTFSVNASGATLTNATLTINTANNRNRILLDPANGIRIQSNPSGTGFVDQFYADSSGNLIFKGNLTGATGTFTGQINATTGNIGGWVVRSDGLYSPNERDYIKSNGNIQLGKLIMTPSNTVFTGDVYASNLKGYITSDMIESLVGNKVGSGINADNITTGGMSASRITAGTISWGEGKMELFMGVPTIVGNEGLTLFGGGGNIGIFSSHIYMNSPKIQLAAGIVEIEGNVTINGYEKALDTRIWVYSQGYAKGNGYTASILVGPAYSNKIIRVSNGLITGYDFM